MFISTILNAILNPVMIHFIGLTGSAWATVISEVLCLLYAGYYHKKKKLFELKSKNISLKYALPLIKVAVPSALQGCMPAISSAMMLFLVGQFGVTTIAAYGVTSKLEILLFYPAMAMNMALTTIIGQCIGRKRMDRAKEYVRSSLILGGAFLAATSIIVIVCSGQLSGMFVHSSEVAQIVRGYFAIVSIGYVLYMITSCFLGELNGMGKPGMSMLLMFIYYIVIRIPLATMLVRNEFGLNGIWIAILVSHILSAAIAVIIVIHTSKTLTRSEVCVSC
jgi:putative MATE family efflux protein